MNHITVLKQEAVALLQLQPHSVVVDATYGAGGHAEEICRTLSSNGTYIGLDADKTAFTDSFLYQKSDGPKFHLINENFAKITDVLSSLHIEKVDAILADLGWRTDQFQSGGKGFSFSSDDPLYMTYGDNEAYLFNAYDIVNSWAEEDIANVIYGYGEERYSRRIAKLIVERRKKAKIMTAKALADVIEEAVPAAYRNGRTNAATKTFQALRIAVNDELKALETFIVSAAEALDRYGILAIISFHSLEDRQVKHAFRELVATEAFAFIQKKPIVPSREELLANPRARSAKLRAIQRVS